MVSVQTGSALSEGLFARFSPVGTTWLRLAWAALILLIVVRPRRARLGRAGLRAAVMLGGVTALQSVMYFQAIARIPLGTATALEFVGPLSVSLAGLRRR